jgi:hypothetical protein
MAEQMRVGNEPSQKLRHDMLLRRLRVVEWRLADIDLDERNLHQMEGGE